MRLWVRVRVSARVSVRVRVRVRVEVRVRVRVRVRLRATPLHHQVGHFALQAQQRPRACSRAPGSPRI